MTEQAQEQAASENTPIDTPEPKDQEIQGKTLTWEEHNRELQRVGKKEKGEGRQTERAAILEELGVEDLDAAKSRLEAYQTIEAETETEADKLQRQAEKLQSQLVELEPYKEKAERYEAAIEAQLEVKTKDLPEHVTDLLGRIDDPLERYEYLTKHEDKLKAPASRVPESPEPFNGHDSAKDDAARAAFERQYRRSF